MGRIGFGVCIDLELTVARHAEEATVVAASRIAKRSAFAAVLVAGLCPLHQLTETFQQLGDVGIAVGRNGRLTSTARRNRQRSNEKHTNRQQAKS